VVGCPQGEIEDRNHSGGDGVIRAFHIPLSIEGFYWEAGEEDKIFLDNDYIVCYFFEKSFNYFN
jgi:hypothetical protein